ncbi:MAG: molybdenum cofactor biosynthesis protein [Dehalococcoidia bacterium]|nr:MAG: molybdenum cofactor biosynthesis protein [Dehalococcoidia bacterium]
MKPFGTLIPFESARDIINRHALPVERTEYVPIDAALGRVSAEDIVALHNTPPFNRAGVDGYAVKASDTSGATRGRPKLLASTDCLYAGSTPSKKLLPGECIGICTGAMMPPGADAVVMVEDTRIESQQVAIYKSLAPQDNVGLKGEDIRKGERVIERDKMLDAGKIGVLASQGLTRVLVYEKPKVAIMPTGEEIVEIGKRLKPGQLYDINSHTLAAVVRENGGEPMMYHVTGDSLEDIRTSLQAALSADMVVTSGGSSMGEKDLIINVLEEWGEVLFHGIKVKPGKPTTFAIVNGKPVLGMPGYPTSCLLNAHLLLGPAVRRMGHLPARRNLSMRAELGDRVVGSSERQRFQTVIINGKIAYPIFKESGAITGTAQADGFIVVPENTVIEKGTEVTVTFF